MSTALIKQVEENAIVIETKPRTTLKEHLQYHYDTFMAEYTKTDERLKENQNKKNSIDREMDNNDYCYRTVRRDNNYFYYDHSYEEWQDSDRVYNITNRKSINDICSNSKYHDLLDKIEEDKKKLPTLKSKLVTLNKKLNNSEYLISLSRKELNEHCDWFVDKIILGVGTNAIGDSNASLHGNIDGGMSGASFLGFGSVSGYVDGEIDGHSNAKYEENVLVKFKYNLDYKIDEILFDINNYL